MAPTIKNVALAGATGNLGSHTLTALVEHGFNVTVLCRTPREFPEGVIVKVVDFSSIDSLSEAVRGQDAVIDNTFTPEIDTPLRLIDAAAANGVYRFITSDYGLDPDLPGIHEMPVFERKRASYHAVKEKSKTTSLTFTLIACGPFLDWGLSTGFAGIQLKDKSATMFNDGTNVVPWTTLEDAGNATAGALLQPENTRNRVVYVHSAFLSQTQLLDLAKGATGVEDWKIAFQDMQPLLDQAMADLRSGNITDMTFGVQIQYCIANRALVHPWERDDNDLLGIREKSPEELRRIILAIASE